MGRTWGGETGDDVREERGSVVRHFIVECSTAERDAGRRDRSAPSNSPFEKLAAAH